MATRAKAVQAAVRGGAAARRFAAVAQEARVAGAAAARRRTFRTEVSLSQPTPARLRPYLKSLHTPAATCAESLSLGHARVTGASVWTGEELKESPWWGLPLSREDVDSLHSAVEAAKASGAAGEVLTPEAFPVGAVLRQKLLGLQEELENGKGLAMIPNMPVGDARFTEEDLATAFLGIAAHVGCVVPQRGRAIKKVSAERGRRMHTERCDVSAALSVRAAQSGGRVRVCSAPAVYNAMLQRFPLLARALCKPLDRLWEGEEGFFRLPVWDLTPRGKFTTQISPRAVEPAQLLPQARKASAEQIAALDALELLAMELGAEFLVRPGMMYLLNNHQVYHGRGSWPVTLEEEQAGWGAEGRLLLKAWISPYNSRELPGSEDYRKVWGSVEAGAPRGGARRLTTFPESPMDSLFDQQVQQHSMWGHAGTLLEH